MNDNDNAYLNRTYFMALRAAATTSLPDACARYGVDVEFATAVASMSLKEIERMADVNLLLFRPAIPMWRILDLARIESLNKRQILVRLTLGDPNSPRPKKNKSEQNKKKVAGTTHL